MPVQPIPDAVRRSRFERQYVIITAAFAVLMVLTNMIGTKLFVLFPDWLPQGFGDLTGHGYVILTTGLITYPLTFLLTDVCSEVYGRARANYMVTIGFLMSILMLVTINVAGWLPRADRYWADAAGQPVQGTQIVHSSEGSVVIDDGSYLLLQEGDTAKAAFVVDGEPTFLDYTGIAKPQHRVPGADADSPIRWDNRGALLAQANVDAPVGSWVVPAVTITAVEGDTITIDRPVNLPPSGNLLTREGAIMSYAVRGQDGALTLNKFWASPTDPGAEDLIVGASLAVWNNYQPAELQKNLISIFSSPGILLFASMLAYLVAQYLDVYMYHFWKRLTNGKHLWLRNNGSTAVSQLVDTIIVNGIFLYFAFGMTFWSQIVPIIICVYIVKMVLAWLDTPLIYLATWWAKKRLGYDWEEDVDTNMLDSSAAYKE